MRRSDAFLATSRDARDGTTDGARLLSRAGMVRQFGSGLYGFTPTGQRVRENLSDLACAAMDAVGGQRIDLPALQYADAWRASGRWAAFEGEMFTLENREGQAMCLAPSHEEGVVRLADGLVRSYDDLPLLLYQVGTKFRDDHARNGLVRTKAFSMKDAYSLHADEAGLTETYDAVRGAYERLFDALDLTYAIVEADNSVMGGTTSEEFVAPAADGGDRLVHCTAGDCRFGVTDERAAFDRWSADDDCPDCGGVLTVSDAVEVAHVFQLGTRYSDAMGFTVDLADGTEQSVVMGSYGIGVDRLLQTVLVQNADADGCRWPVTQAGSVAPYRAAIVPVRYEGDLREAADDLYDACGRDDVLLFDDREQSVGERFAESDLIGIPVKVVLGNHYRETGEVELETRDGETRSVTPGAVPAAVERYATDFEKVFTRRP